MPLSLFVLSSEPGWLAAGLVSGFVSAAVISWLLMLIRFTEDP